MRATDPEWHGRGLDERGRPICGHWQPGLGPCICADPANHELGGKFARDETA